MAAACGYAALAMRLIVQGAPLNALDDDGNDALSLAGGGVAVEAVAREMAEEAAAAAAAAGEAAAAAAAAAAATAARFADAGAAPKPRRVLVARIQNKIDASEQLMSAAGAGDTGALRVLLRSGDVHAQYRSAEGSTPLHEACTLPSISSLEILLRFGGESLLGLLDGGGRALIHIAAAAEVYDEQLLARLAAQRHATDYRGWTPLHHAAATGSAQACAWLLRHGCSSSAAAADGCSALHVAAVAGRGDVCVMLLQGGAAGGAAEEEWYEGKQGQEGEEGEAGEAGEVCWACGACEARAPPAGPHGPHALRALRASGIQVDQHGASLWASGALLLARDGGGATAAQLALRAGLADTARLLLRLAPASLHMRDGHGRGPLHEASGSGEPRAVLALLVAFGGRCSCAHAAVASGAHGGGRSGCIGDSLALMASDDAGCGALLAGRARLEAEAASAVEAGTGPRLLPQHRP